MHEGSEIEKEAGSADPRRSWSEKKETGKRERRKASRSHISVLLGCRVWLRLASQRLPVARGLVEHHASARAASLSSKAKTNVHDRPVERCVGRKEESETRREERERGRERQEGSGGEAVEKASVKETGGVKLETSDSKKQTEGKGKRGEARGSREERAKASTGVREREGEGKRRGEREDAMRVLIK